MKTLLALLLLIPSLSWGENFFISCLATKYKASIKSDYIYFEKHPHDEDIVNFYINMKEKVIGRQNTIGFTEFEFTNEQDEYVCGGFDKSTDIVQYICINRYTLELTIHDSNSKEWTDRYYYRCKPVDKKF